MNTESILLKVASAAIALLAFLIKDLYSKHKATSMVVSDIKADLRVYGVENKHIEDKLDKMDEKLDKLIERESSKKE